MHHRSAPFEALCAALPLLFAGASHATPQPLADAEMSAVRGADGSILARFQAPSARSSQNAFSAGLAAAFESSTGATLLTPAQFATALEVTGFTPAMLADYAGQPVAQTVVDAKPVTFSFDLSAMLQATTGLQYNSGPSMGTITMKDFDARGTTLWVWQHH
jgi:hypothetical protein